jgi:hypothetical protein
MHYLDNLLLNTDSYKASHWLQYPPGTDATFFYVESRGGLHDRTVFFGLQAILKDALARPVTHADIDDAAAVFAAHGEPFNEAGWRDIVDRLGGHLPVRIRAVPEGSVVPTHQALMTIESTDPAAFWVPSYLETLLLRVWYPVTVATISWHARQTIAAFLQQTSDDPQGSCRSSCTTSARAVYRAWNRPRWAVPRTWSTSSAPIPYRPCAWPARTITRRWPAIRFPPPSTAPSPAGAASARWTPTATCCASSASPVRSWRWCRTAMTSTAPSASTGVPPCAMK